MTTTETTRSLDEIRRAGLEALRREFGPRELILFLRQFIKPSGDYTAERAELHAGTDGGRRDGGDRKAAR